MSIAVTEILGTDSLSGSRLVLNDNFNILASEINAIEVYFNPTAGTITNLNDVKTESLRVGLSTVLLDINANAFNILTNVNASGNISLNGATLFRNDTNPQTQNDIFAGPSMTIQIGTSTAIPPFTIERVGNASASVLNIQLNNGTIGQEIFFMYTEPTTGNVEISGAVDPIIVQGGNSILLNQKGDTVHLLCIDDGTGNGDWYVIGGSSYTVDNSTGSTGDPSPPSPPVTTFTVSNSGQVAYIVNNALNPTLTLTRGTTYTFNIAATGHPFWIKTALVSGTGSAYNSGVTNNGIANGTITFTVPSNAPATLYYVCQNHIAMAGIINIIN